MPVAGRRGWSGNVMWRAYLSTQGANAVNARDRIGNLISAGNSLDEKGQPVPNTFPGSEHDILTGSTLDGRAYTDNTRDFTCSNWTSAADGTLPEGVAGRDRGRRPVVLLRHGRGYPLVSIPVCLNRG